ncbi:acyl carrier protein [Streptomyces erythrochromogenes]|uniref:acyl carrier protein n=1 Tax=Streptomyces erythrochromogenes TaxID=285574 RepID=UPI003419F839
MEPQNAPAEDASDWLWQTCTAIVDCPLGPDGDLFAAGLTSLGVVQLVGAVRRRHSVRLTGTDIYDNPTVDQLGALITARIAHDA